MYFAMQCVYDEQLHAPWRKALFFYYRDWLPSSVIYRRTLSSLDVSVTPSLHPCLHCHVTRADLESGSCVERAERPRLRRKKDAFGKSPREARIQLGVRLLPENAFFKLK